MRLRRMLGANDRRTRFGLSLKIVAIAGASTAIVALILALSFGREVEKLLEQELADRGRLAALALANSSATLVFAQDVSGLEALTAATLADVPGAAYVIARDERGRPLAEAVREDSGRRTPEGGGPRRAGPRDPFPRALRQRRRPADAARRLAHHLQEQGRRAVPRPARHRGGAGRPGGRERRREGARLGRDRVPLRRPEEPDRRREPQVARARVRGARGLSARDPSAGAASPRGPSPSSRRRRWASRRGIFART